MDRSKGRRRWFVSLAAVLAISIAARAADIAVEVGQLATAVDARLGGDASGKEAKKLTALSKKLAKLTGSAVDPADLGGLLSAVYGSTTTDADVLAEAQDVLDCLRDSAVAQKAAAELVGEELDAAFRAKLDARLDAAQEKLDAAEDLAEADPKKAAKLLQVAYAKFQKATSFAERAIERLSRLGDKVEIRATLVASGDRREFNAFASGFDNFGSVLVQGCRDASGPQGLCRQVLTVDFQYPSGSVATGPVFSFQVTYADSSDFGNGSGPGVQDIRWSSLSSPSVQIVESTTRTIKGRFSATLQAEGPHQPQAFEVSGSFVIRRPKPEQF